jgi:hypothetical protein
MRILLRMVVSVGLFCFFLGGRGADVFVVGRSECDGVDVSVAEEPIGGSWFCFFVGGVLMRVCL